jgi:hypothetical protein
MEARMRAKVALIGGDARPSPPAVRKGKGCALPEGGHPPKPHPWWARRLSLRAQQGHGMFAPGFRLLGLICFYPRHRSSRMPKQYSPGEYCTQGKLQQQHFMIGVDPILAVQDRVCHIPPPSPCFRTPRMTARLPLFLHDRRVFHHRERFTLPDFHREVVRRHRSIADRHPRLRADVYVR